MLQSRTDIPALPVPPALSLLISLPDLKLVSSEVEVPFQKLYKDHRTVLDLTCVIAASFKSPQFPS